NVTRVMIAQEMVEISERLGHIVGADRVDQLDFLARVGVVHRQIPGRGHGLIGSPGYGGHGAQNSKARGGRQKTPAPGAAGSRHWQYRKNTRTHMYGAAYIPCKNR